MSRATYWFLLAILVLITFLGRWHFLKDTEPRIDQADFATSIRGIAEADHVWPRRTPGQSFQQALLADQESLIHRIGRPVFNFPRFCLNAVPAVIASLVCWLFSYSYAKLVFLSILATCLSLLLLGYLPFAALPDWHDKPAFVMVMGLGAALAYASALQVSLFSPWGVHNAAVFFLVLAVIASVRLMRNAECWQNHPVQSLLWTALFTGLACYSHWTNGFLLIPAVAVGLLTIPDLPLRRRATLSIGFGLLAGLILIPVGILTMVLHRLNDNFLIFVNTGHSARPLLEGLPSRAWKWCLAGSELFSAPGLLLGIGGLAWIARKYRITLPLLCLVVHFLAYCLMPGFIWAGSPTWLRTYNYVIPFLAIGIGAAVAVVWQEALQGRLAVTARVLVAMFLLLHLYAQVPWFHPPEWMRSRSPAFYECYLRGQGNLRPSVIGLAEAIPENAPVWFWNYPLRHIYQSLIPSSYRHPLVSSTILVVLEKTEAGLPPRDLPSMLPANTHVVAPTTVPREELAKALRMVLRPVGGSDQGGIFVLPKGQWETNTLDYGTFVLYDVQPVSLGRSGHVP